MARLAVNPTRMELRRLKTRLKTATRGHKLLKDKSDEMVRRFMEYIRVNKELREEIEKDVGHALRSFMLARAVCSAEDMEQALAMPKMHITVDAETQNVMGIDVPSLSLSVPKAEDLLPYAFSSAPSDLDAAVIELSTLMQKLLRLAEVEKTCNMLADEIERNRRRVNALENVLIPNLEETIKYILMKLDENERGNITRLMKVKSMMNN
ncbi:MAG: V-type ATP synthase subunit D [Clostridiales bacterium]|nr:V-type ATP synthase subunit D [Clostridiales bacterium]